MDAKQYHEEQHAAVSKAAEFLAPRFDAVIVIATYRDPQDGGTCHLTQQAGNLHAVEGMVREKLRKIDGYEAGFHHEEGRYDSVTIRQRNQRRAREAE